MILALQIVGLLALATIVYLATVIFGPFRQPRQPLPVAATGDPSPSASANGSRVTIDVDGTEICGTLYVPEGPGPFPCVVMNHGLGGTQDMLLGQYAGRFAAAGIAALTYDYRHFGDSGGEPRQLFDLDRQVEDSRRAIAFVRDHDAIDEGRIGIWGTSAGGGYGFVIAATDPAIRCVVAQCPSLDHGADGRMAFAREGIGYMLRLMFHGQRDKGRSRVGLAAHRIPIAGPPGSTALINAPGALEGYARIAGANFRNEICARVMLTPHGPLPHNIIDQVRCPALVQLCEKDTVASASGSAAQAERMGDFARVERFPIGHFDIYFGEHHEIAVASQVAFLAEHLGVETGGEGGKGLNYCEVS